MESIQQNDGTIDSESDNAELWVLEGKMDFPVVLPRPDIGPNKNSDVRGFAIDLSNGDGDGFLELHASDVTRANTASWWSKDEPVLFDFRCSVVAGDPLIAWLRANDFTQKVLDRLTFLAGIPATLVTRSLLYNETELLACKNGTRSSFRCQMGGIPTSTTGPIWNLHLIQRLRPSDRAALAMRWFRKALSFEKEEDKFLGFFVALEVISDDVKPAAVRRQLFLPFSDN